MTQNEVEQIADAVIRRIRQELIPLAKEAQQIELDLRSTGYEALEQVANGLEDAARNLRSLKP